MTARGKYTFRLSTEIAARLADYATRTRVPQAQIVEAALASHLSPDAADRLEAALARRLDRMTRVAHSPLCFPFYASALRPERAC